MASMLTPIRTLAAVAVAATLALTPGRAVAVDDADVAQRVATAKTPADHEALAAYYTGQAAAARKQAELHRRMQATYATGSATGKGIGPVPMPQHCSNLVKANETAAAEYDAMAAAHRTLAQAAR